MRGGAEIPTMYKEMKRNLNESSHWNALKCYNEAHEIRYKNVLCYPNTK